MNNQIKDPQNTKNLSQDKAKEFVKVFCGNTRYILDVYTPGFHGFLSCHNSYLKEFLVNIIV